MKGKVLAMLVAMTFILSSFTVVSAAKPESTPSPVIEKAVFIHYKEAPDKPPWAGGPGGPGGGKAGEEGKGYKLLRGGVKWADEDLPVSYSVNPTGSGFGEDAVNAITAAFETWDAEVSKELFNDVVETIGLSGAVRDDRNTVSWAYIADGDIVAQCTFWFYVNTKEMVEFDIVFNNQQPWGIDPDGENGVVINAFDIQNIATHESGHTLVLEDLYEDKYSEMTMYGYASIGEVKKRSLAWGDINGVNELYGP